MSDGSAVRDEVKMCNERNVDQDLQRIFDRLITEEDNNGTLWKSEEYDGFDESVGETWIYPDNLPCRPYQLSISKAALYQNTLVVLPTGLGKTFIAAVVMYNIYRWYPKGKVIFMAPSRPLVTQQIAACQRIMPFPDKDTVELTGRMTRARRIELWRRKRVFFATPRDVRSDIAGDGGTSLDGFEFPYDTIKLIVVDEAHKTRGRFAYTDVAQSILQRNPYIRVLALSATPGRTTDDVAEVVRNLFISHLEVRSEKSVDVMHYVHETMKTIVVPNPFNVSAVNMTNGVVAEMPSDLDFEHPKFEEARSCLLQHFETHPDTRAIIFCEYRESVTLIYRLLLQHKPLLRPRCFIGEGGTTGSLRALTQKQQIQIMNDFRAGKSNILVATSIAQKGIDVCEVELIVCFDIRTSHLTHFMQRIGRTGWQRKGNVVMIVTEGREHQQLQNVLRPKENSNMELLQSQAVKEALYRNAPRLVPPEYNPECLKTFIKPPSDEEEEQTAAKRLGPLPKATKGKKGKTIKDAVQKERQALRQNYASREKSDIFNLAEPSGTAPSPLQMDACSTAEWASVRNYELQIELQPVIEKLAKTTPPLMAPPLPLQPADHHQGTVNKQLQLAGPLPPATLSRRAMLAQLRSKVMTREAKLLMLRMNALLVRDACESMLVLDALEIDAAAMTAEEQAIRRTHKQIVEVFGSAQALDAFVEQAGNEENYPQLCRTRIDNFDEPVGSRVVQFGSQLKKIFDHSCGQLDFKCHLHEHIKQHLDQTQRNCVEAALRTEDEYKPSMVYDWNEKPSDSELNNSTSVFDASTFVESPRPANRQSTPSADGPLARAFKRQRDRASQPSIAQLLARVEEKNGAKKTAGNGDDVVVISDCQEEPSTSALMEHQIVDEQPDEDFNLMELEDWEPQMEAREEQPQLEKQPQTTDQSIMELEKVALPPPAAANDLDLDLAAFFDPFSGEDEVLAAVDLNIKETCSGQVRSHEELKPFFGCSLKEKEDKDKDLNNVMRTREVRQSPDIGINSNEKTDLVPISPGAVPDIGAEETTTTTTTAGARLRKKSTKHKIFDDDEDEGDGEEMHEVTSAESIDWEEAIDFTQKQQTQQQVPPQKRLKRLRTQPKKKRRVGACSFIAEEAAVSGSDKSGDEAEYATDQYLHDTCIPSSAGEEHSGELPQTQMQAVYLQFETINCRSPPQRRPGAFKIPEFRIFDDHDQIYSQAPPPIEDESQCDLDSFVVNENDDEQAGMSKRRQRRAAKKDDDDASMCPLERDKLIKQERRSKRLQRR